MSKVGQKPIEYGADVTVTVQPGGSYGGQLITVKGPKAELSLSIRRGVEVKQEGNTLTLERKDDTNKNKSFHGLYRTLIANMIVGVTTPYEKKLEVVGVGYRANQVGEGIELSVGFSHKVKFNPPAGITVKVGEENTIIISGSDKTLVGQVAADIRAIRKPEPYKGKGIRYQGEVVRKKVGKAGTK